MATDLLSKKLHKWKTNLIDLSKRNRLLNFKDNTSSVIQFNPDIDQVFGLLANDKAIKVNSIADIEKFIIKEKRARKKKLGLEQDSDDAFEDVESSAYERLENALSAIRLKAKSSLDEKGVNTLFITFGLLTWKESKDSNIEMKSPLLLLPVTLKRESSDKPYYLEKYDDDLTLNPTLIQKLKLDFGLQIPSFESEEELDITKFIKDFSNYIKDFKEWSVSQDSYLGLFSFSKLVMYKDFEQFSEQIKQHSLVQQLAGLSNEHTQSIETDTISIREHDRTSKSVSSFQVLDADSSQQEAILAANKGQSFIISGPPGTGKSQTISNIIADSLAKGKRVLFVSEKKAALEVVKRRLDSQNLGDFVLELHSNNANKKYVLDELYRTLKLQVSPNPASLPFEPFDKIKMLLNNYVDAVHTAVEPLGFTAQRVHGELAKLDKIDELTFSIEDIKSLDKERLDLIFDLLQRLGQYDHILKNSDNHIWKGTSVDRFTFELQSDIASKFKRLAENLTGVNKILGSVVDLIGTDWSLTPDNIQKNQELSSLFSHVPKVPISWLKNDDALSENSKLYEKASEKFENYHNEKISLTKKYAEEVTQLDLEQQKSALESAVSQLQLILQNPLEYIDSLITSNRLFYEAIKQAQHSIQTLESIRSYTTEMFDIEFEQITLNEVKKIQFILEKVTANLTPTENWFDEESTETLHQILKEGKTQVEEYVADKAKFSQKYDLELLQRDELKGMLDRFMKQYTSIFHIFNKSYRQDQKVFKFYLKSGKKLKFDEMLQDVKLAARLNEKQTWIKQEDENLKRWLGKLYKGEETDWELLQSQIHQVDELCAFIKSNNLAKEKLIGLLLHPNASDIEKTSKYLQELIAAQEQYQASKPELEKAIKTDVIDLNNAFVITLLNDILKKIIVNSDPILNTSNTLRNFAVSPVFTGYKELKEDIFEILNFMGIRRDIENEMAHFSQAFGALFNGYETNWTDVLAALEWTKKLTDILGKHFPEPIVLMVVDEDSQVRGQHREITTGLNQSWQHSYTLLQFFYSVFPIDGTIFENKTFRQTDLSNSIEKLNVWAEESYRLEEWTALKRILIDAKSFGIEEFVEQIKELKDSQKFSITELFLKRFYKLWLDFAYEALPNLANFNIDQHKRLISEFKRLDQSQLTANGARVHGILNNKKSTIINSIAKGSQLTTLNKELAKKRHKAIRKLFSEIPDLLLALKPCIMMSPMSVSQFIDPTILGFDLVIFDEASQLCSEDAIGSIFRGKQIIIAGDKKQLPPTKFFGTSIEEDEEFMDEEDESNDSYESVLDEASIFMKERPLLWHYRSKNESLIAFSNREIYEDELYTFPSSTSGSNEGVSLVYVPEGIYERSTSRRNLIEAKVVASLVFDHIRRSPRRSLGVIAFSEAQQQAIYDQVQALRKASPQFEEFFGEDKSEPFFVKNLENVQGDERDTIFFSVGYGKDSTGVLHYNFGPLNKPGGERRLNVAVTRAKYEIKLVSSILHSDLDDSKLNKRGPQLLKSYLYYAKTGGEFTANTGIQNNGEFDSPLEQDVYEALTSRGVILRKQVGCSSYRIDLAVVDPNNPGSYLLGIECDGAAYHSSKTARDRDRLRQEVLESLGWKIHRIWSQDWFRRKREEIDKILSTLLVHTN
ncbi:DUF4011 domain-containing protein [Paenibacillus sp. GP183]|uniref:DUF4011 domain-containing protein n=1 Tax=Paenibacillus sp. GP183 TaxID=1882751 RepID=UPI0008950DE8|nr:DUF4011 domain-containing protein [Paenibacillus sp. GP183]SEB45486.1 Protein of unknown function [Paenibacillus sp. GP183]